MKSFAIIRHAKIKNGRHLVSAGLHNARMIDPPNADVDAAPVRILVGSNRPWRDVMNAHRRLGIEKLKKDGNAAIEVVLAASPEWWGSKGWKPGVEPSGETLALVDDWIDEGMAYLDKRFGKHLIASVVFHPDEASPHIHALVIPAQYRTDGREKARDDDGRPIMRWRLSTEKVLPGPTAMKKIVTEYAEAMQRFGLVRGEDRPMGTVRHKPLKEWQAEQADLSKQLKEELMNQEQMTAQATLDAARIRREAMEYAAATKAKADREAHELTVNHAELMRRKADESNAVKLELDRELQRVRETQVELDAERAEVMTLRQKLKAMIEKCDVVLQKVRSYADQYLNGSAMIRLGIGPKGSAAQKIVESEEVAELGLMTAFVRKVVTPNDR